MAKPPSPDSGHGIQETSGDWQQYFFVFFLLLHGCCQQAFTKRRIRRTRKSLRLLLIKSIACCFTAAGVLQMPCTART